MKKQGNPKKTWTTKATSSPSEKTRASRGPGREPKGGPGGHGGSTGTAISTFQCTFFSQHPAMFKPQGEVLVPAEGEEATASDVCYLQNQVHYYKFDPFLL